MKDIKKKAALKRVRELMKMVETEEVEGILRMKAGEAKQLRKALKAVIKEGYEADTKKGGLPTLDSIPSEFESPMVHLA